MKSLYLITLIAFGLFFSLVTSASHSSHDTVIIVTGAPEGSHIIDLERVLTSLEDNGTDNLDFSEDPILSVCSISLYTQKKFYPISNGRKKVRVVINASSQSPIFILRFDSEDSKMAALFLDQFVNTNNIYTLGGSILRFNVLN